MKKPEFWIGVIIFVIGCVLFGMSFSYEYYSTYGPGAGFFPRWISALLIIVSLMYVVEQIKNKSGVKGGIFPRGRQLQYVLRIAMSFALLILLAPITGYTIASIVMLFVLFTHDYKWHLSLGLSTGISILLVTVFYRILSIPVPINSFGW